MAITATYTRGYTVGSQSFGATATISSSYDLGWSVSLAAAKSGTLTTRSSDTAGTLTMASGHGITDGQRLDIYWTGGQCYGATVGTVATNSVPFTGASGTVLPIATTAITAQVPTLAPLVVTGDDVVGIGVSMPTGGIAVFATSVPANVYAASLTATATSYVYTDADGGTNPLAGASVARVYLSHGTTAEITATGEVQFN